MHATICFVICTHQTAYMKTKGKNAADVVIKMKKFRIKYNFIIFNLYFIKMSIRYDLSGKEHFMLAIRHYDKNDYKSLGKFS